MRSIKTLIAIVALSLAASAPAAEKVFPAGSLVVPMDTEFQDSGMLEAYGLVYALLSRGVPVDWTIAPDKVYGGVDFRADAEDVRSLAAIANHGYRGGPFVVDAAHAVAALPIVAAWQAAHARVAVHRATAPFSANVSRELTNAPTIAVFSDGLETDSFAYLNAAGIPMSNGSPWPSKKDPTGRYSCPGSLCCPDCLSEAQVAGSSALDHTDGALFDGKGIPRFCQVVAQQTGTPSKLAEVAAELRAFAEAPVHVFAQGPAAVGLENNADGLFLTTGGLVDGGSPVSAVDRFHADVPTAQADGDYSTTRGNVASFSLNPGSAYHDPASVLMSVTGAAPGTSDVLLSGFVDGNRSKGRVTYLGGNGYETDVPISGHPKTQGTRYYLDGLFEAPCATADGAPRVGVAIQGASGTNASVHTISVCWENSGVGLAFDGALALDLPVGAVFVSATDGGVQVGTRVVWDLDTLSPGSGACPSVTVSFVGEGEYAFVASLAYSVGLNRYQVSSDAPFSVRFGSVNLLRFATTSLTPMTPSPGQIFTGTWPQTTTLDPVRDLEAVAFASGGAFPHAVADLAASSAPLVFYQLDGDAGDTLRVSKQSGIVVVTY